MRILRRAVSGLATLAVGVGMTLAQAPEGTPKPGPEHEKLARFIGTWSGKGEMKPGPFGPGGPMTWTETCEQFSGGFSVVCKSEGKGPLGENKGLSIIAYNPEEKVYTWYGVDSSGWADLSKGTLSGKVWSFTSSSTMGGKLIHSRFSLTEIGDNKQTFKWEMSEDGKTWNNMMEGESVK